MRRCPVRVLRLAVPDTDLRQVSLHLLREWMAYREREDVVRPGLYGWDMTNSTVMERLNEREELR